MHRLLLVLTLLASVEARADNVIASSDLFPPMSVRVKESPAAQRFLAAVGAKLSEDRSRFVRIQVHADERYGNVDNAFLANQRAKALDKALRKLGAKKKQLMMEAVGESGVERTPRTSRIEFDFSDDVSVPAPTAN